MSLVHNIVLHSIAVLYSSAAESKLEYGNSLFMCESVCIMHVCMVCVSTQLHGMSLTSPSLVSLMITYSMQKHCFLQEFITVRVCNSHMVSIPTILSYPDGRYRDHRGVLHSYHYELLLFFSVCPSTGI